MHLNRFLKKSFFLSLPFLLAFLCVLLGQSSFSFMPYYHQAFPFVLAIIFYFAIFNPIVMNVFFVFLLGLISDSLSALPLGFSSFVYVFVFFIANLFRSYLFLMPFYQLWIVYAVLLLCSDIIWAFLFFMISGVWVSAGFWFVQYLLTVLLYPVFCWICGLLNKKIKELL